MIDAVLAWCGQNWEIVAIVLGLIMKGLNWLTGHYSEHKHVVKLLLRLVDLLDVVKNTPAPVKPKRSDSIRIGPTMVVLSLLLLAGCAPTLSGKLAQGHSVINVAATAALKGISIECRARVKACVARGVKKSVDCAPFRACDNARAGLEAAVLLVEDGLKAVNQAAKNAKAAGVLP